jgi:hypothetical protein
MISPGLLHWKSSLKIAEANFYGLKEKASVARNMCAVDPLNNGTNNCLVVGLVIMQLYAPQYTLPDSVYLGVL